MLLREHKIRHQRACVLYAHILCRPIESAHTFAALSSTSAIKQLNKARNCSRHSSRTDRREAISVALRIVLDLH